MILLNKNKKKWIYSMTIAAVLVLGTLMTLKYSTLFQDTLSIQSNCRFNPAIDPHIKELISETILTVANDGLFSLMGKEKQLKAMGAEVEKATTDFAYWAYVITTPELLQGMKKIQKSSIKYKGFIKGTRDKELKEYSENSCFLGQAEGFAKYAGLPVDGTLDVLKEALATAKSDKYSFKKFIDYIISNKT